MALRASLLSVILLLALAGTALGHTANSNCNPPSITLAKAGNHTADVLTHARPPVLVLNDVPGNGTYPIAPGTYDVLWSDGYRINGLEVTVCPTPTPTATATPTATPSPTPSPTATPTTAPTPTPSDSPSPSLTPSPRITLPPTATDGTTPPSSPSLLPLLILAMVSGFALTWKRVR